MTIRAVVIGAGRMGKNHVRTVHNSARFKLVAAVDPALPVIADTRCVASLGEVGNDFDVAIVAVPTSSHYAVGKALLEAGKHVLLEKPLAATAVEARELAALARKLDRKLAVGHVERFNPAVQKLAEVIRSGVLGTPIHFSFTRVGGYPRTTRPRNDVVLELAVHDIDVFSSLCGECKLVASRTHTTADSTVADTATMLLLSRNGVTADIHTNRITPTKIRKIRVTGTAGVCFVDYILQTCELWGGNLLTRTAPAEVDYQQLRSIYANADKIQFGVNTQEPLVLQLAQFADFIERDEAGQLCLADSAAATVAIAEAARRDTRPP